MLYHKINQQYIHERKLYKSGKEIYIKNDNKILFEAKCIKDISYLFYTSPEVNDTCIISDSKELTKTTDASFETKNDNILLEYLKFINKNDLAKQIKCFLIKK